MGGVLITRRMVLMSDDAARLSLMGEGLSLVGVNLRTRHSDLLMSAQFRVCKLSHIGITKTTLIFIFIIIVIVAVIILVVVFQRCRLIVASVIVVIVKAVIVFAN